MIGDVPQTTKQEAFAVFLNAARRIWSNAEFVVPACRLSDEEPSDDTLASLAWPSNQRVAAIGNSIIQRPSYYALRVSVRLLSMGDAAVQRVMIHEAVHLGHSTHGREFRALVTAHGGTVSESSIGNPTVKLQMKVGSKYQTVAEFQDEREAEIAARSMMQARPGKYRMLFGV